MIDATFKVDARFKRSVQGRYEGHVFQVGILKDGPHRNPRQPRSLTAYRGGPARRPGRKTTGRISDVSEMMRKRFHIYTAPFQKKRSRDLLALTKAIGDFLSGKRKTGKRVETALVNVIVNPILKGKYGRNARSTAKAKGFNRLMIDTAQLVKAISARVTRRSGSR